MCYEVVFSDISFYQITFTLVSGALLLNLQLEDREGEVRWKKNSHK